MLELILAFIVGAAVNRAGAKYISSLPEDSPFKRPGAVIFGGGGPKPTK